jgi:tRNA-dihydrouridine synthase 1
MAVKGEEHRHPPATTVVEDQEEEEEEEEENYQEGDPNEVVVPPSVSDVVHDKMGGFEFYEKVLKRPKYVVAPMVDQSFLAFRMFTRQYGAELCYTPMFHSKIFANDATYRKKFFTTAPEDRPLVVQFCANEPLYLLKAAKFAEDRCDAIDLNLGCPQNIARKGNYGAFLMENPTLVYEMVNILHRYLKVPVFCKMRILPSEEDTLKFAKMLESAGCQLLTVHGRTKEQKGHQQGLANLDLIRKIKEAVSIPVIANGNIREFGDVQKNLDVTKADGVMSAETILSNPALYSGKDIHPCDLSQEFMDICENKYPLGFKFIRTHLLQILKEKLDYNADLRLALSRVRNIAQTRKVVEEIRKRDEVAGPEKVMVDIELRKTRASAKVKHAEREFVESFDLFPDEGAET